MKGYIFGYGALAGVLVISTIVLGIVLGGSDSPLGSELAGYLVMLVALSLIFVATKRYRDRELGGVIRFGKAFALGLGIAAVAGAAYVIVWEIYLAATDYAFIDDYATGVVAAEKAAGATADELAAVVERVTAAKVAYGKPWLRILITFSEIFPVGAIVALISAALLRNPRLLPAGPQTIQS